MVITFEHFTITVKDLLCGFYVMYRFIIEITAMEIYLCLILVFLVVYIYCVLSRIFISFATHSNN